MKSMIRDIFTTFLVAVVVFFVLQVTIQVSIINGSSMEPDLYDGQRLIINKAVYFFEKPGRGDIIVFHPSENHSSIPFIKRIIGLPGDTIEINDGQVLLDGEPLYEPYIKEPPGYQVKKLVVPPDSYFVLGDNRNLSNDSHSGWTVPRSQIIGKAWVSIWPPPLWGLAPHYAPK
ncbi:MAG: signal peptidase I [Chloroflexota bacterium]